MWEGEKLRSIITRPVRMKITLLLNEQPKNKSRVLQAEFYSLLIAIETLMRGSVFEMLF